MATDAFGFDSNKFKVAIDAAIQEALEDFDLTSLISSNLEKMYPVGSIYISEKADNPSTFFGFGTWVQYAKGRTLVGVDSADSQFAAPGNTGGSKELQKHRHEYTSRYRLRDSITPGGNKNDDIWKGSDGTNFKHEIVTAPDTQHGDVQASYYLQGVNKTGTVQESKITIGGYTTSVGDGTSGNLQPYITVYIWKRTA